MRSNGSVQDLRLPLDDGQEIQILTTRDTHDPDALAVLRHSTAHLLAEAVRRLYPGVKVAIGPPIENGFYYDFEFPEPIAEEDLERIEAEIRKRARRGPRLGARRGQRRRGPRALRGGGRAVQARARRHGRRADLALPAGRLHRPLPRPAPAELEADQGGQADRARRRVLAGRREEQAADPDLRHRVLHQGGPGRAPAPARRGAPPRPSPARAAARSLPPLRPLAGLAVLAPEGHGDLELARGPAPQRERKARLLRGEDAAPLRRGDLPHVGTPAELRGEHLLGARPRGRREAPRAEADELPRPHASLRLAHARATRSCRCASPSRRPCTATSAEGRCTVSCA